MLLTETGIITWIQQNIPGGASLTDDCGRVPIPEAGETLLVTADLMESGQHFRIDWHPPRMLGRKLLAVNLSDLDSSGARPLGFLLTLAVGSDIDSSFLEQVLEGLLEAAVEYGVPIIGGDTVGRKTGLGLGITAFGATKRWLQRNGVQVGDNVFVDNMPGASHRGLCKLTSGSQWDSAFPHADILAHLAPRPEIGLGVKLAELPQVHACIDISDGLCKELCMLADASGLSIIVEPEILGETLYGGEDYSRCFASSLSLESLQEQLDRKFYLVAKAIPKSDAPLLQHHENRLRPVEDRSFRHIII